MRTLVTTLLVISTLLSACSTLRQDLEAPELTVSKVALVDAGLLQQDWEITLKAYNPNNKTLTVKQLHYELFIDDKRFARGSTNNTVVLKAHENGEFTTQVSTGLLETLRQLKQLNITLGQPVPYRIKGSAKVGKVPLALPFDKQGNVPLPAW